MQNKKILYCDKPDRDVPKLKCGYPLPCPYHTVIIDNGNITLPPNIHPTLTETIRLQQIAKIMKE